MFLTISIQSSPESWFKVFLPTNRYPANTVVTHPNKSCDNGDIRIVGGESELEGRVEVCLRGVWGTVCGVDWTDREAAVVCNQTGHAITGESSRKTNVHMQV